MAIPCMTCTTCSCGVNDVDVSLALFVTITKTIAPGKTQKQSPTEPRTHSAITCQSESF